MSDPKNILTNITPPRVPMTDSRTGLISREWYRFFLSLFTLTGSGQNYTSLTDLQVGPPVSQREDLTSIAIEIDGQKIQPLQESSIEQIAELQKQVQALALQTRPELGTMSALQQDNVPWLRFDTTPQGYPTGTAAAGTLYWDDADGIKTLNLVMEDSGGVIQQIGEETYYRIKADADITNGQVVMFTGTVGASGALKGAPATGLTAFQNESIMGVATQNIAHNGWGYVTWFGLVRGINTTGGAEAWVDGQILYYNPAVPGGLTKNAPTAPNPKVIVASVVNAATNGSLFVRPTFGSALGATDSNVQIGTLANGNLLIYNESTSRWENATLTAGTNVTITNGPGSITINSSNPGGTVTSVGLSAPTGFSVSGSPVTNSGTLALSFAAGYSLPTNASQTNWNTAYSERQQWDGGSTNLVAATGRTSLGATTLGSNLFTIANPGAVTFPRFNADNSVSALSASAFRTAIGAGTGDGSVTSVGLSAPTGFSVSGSPVTGSGTLTIAFSAGYSLPTTTSQTNWDTAYTDRLKWDGGSTGLVAATGRTSLGATTVGSNLFTLTNPSAITFLRVNADNSVSTLDAASFRTAIGLGNVENTALSTWAGSTNITTLGTVSTGTWSGTTITVNKGGTGLTSLTANYVPYGNGTSAFQSSSNFQFDGTHLGIGMTPSAMIDVTGKGTGLSNQIRFTGYDYTPAAYIVNRNSISNGTYSQFLVQENGTDAAWFRQYGSAYGSGISNYVDVWAAANGGIRFGANNAEVARMDPSANMSLGNTNSTYQIDTTGFNFLKGISLGIGHPTGTSNGTAYLVFGYNGSNIGSVTQLSTSSVSFNITSDYRLKTVTGPVTGSGAFIDALEPVNYIWTADGVEDAGFLAHKVQAITKNTVFGKKDAVDEKGNPVYQQMSYASPEILANIVAELQDLRRRLKDAKIA